MKSIMLTQDYYAYVDDQDHEWLSQWNWFAHKGGNTYYAERAQYTNGKRYSIRMHNEIVINRMNLIVPPGCKPDHEDRNGLNNQRHNLRIATNSQNVVNRWLKENATKFRGVYKNYDKFIAQITINGKVIHIPGRYNTPEEAYEVYKREARKEYGEFVVFD